MSLLKLRALEPEDVDLLYLWENDPDVWVVSHTLTPFSKFTLKEFIDASLQDIYAAKQLRLMLESTESKAAVGAIDVFDFDPFHSRAGVGILIDKRFRRQGFAKEAVALIKEYLFSVLQIHQIYCDVLANNEISLHLFKSAGFNVVGCKKDWIKTKEGYEDEYLLQIISDK